MTQTIEGTVEEVIRELFIRRVPMGTKVSLLLEEEGGSTNVAGDPVAFLDAFSDGVSVPVSDESTLNREEIYADHD